MDVTSSTSVQLCGFEKKEQLEVQCHEEGALPTLSALPPEILIPICQQLHLQDLLAFRLTSRHISLVVSTHSPVIAPVVARNQFPYATLLLRAPKSGCHDLTWLQSLVPKYLAAVLVDRARLTPSTFQNYVPHIPAESPLGDTLRARVENGWRILKQLSDISKDVYALPGDEFLPTSTLSVKNLLQSTRLYKYYMAFKETRHSERSPTSISWIRDLANPDNSLGLDIADDFFSRREAVVAKRRFQYFSSLPKGHMEEQGCSGRLLQQLGKRGGNARRTSSLLGTLGRNRTVPNPEYQCSQRYTKENVERLTRGPHRGPKNCVKALLKAFPEYRAGYNSYDAATYDELDKYQTWFSQNVQDSMQLSGDRLMEMLDAIPFPWMDIIGIPFSVNFTMDEDRWAWAGNQTKEYIEKTRSTPRLAFRYSCRCIGDFCTFPEANWYVVHSYTITDKSNKHTS
jgi:hypothetical protein